jgi:glycosyltransferase involved in cell wall biosynthesis
VILAGNKSPGEAHEEYFSTRVAPLVDGDRVQYVGPVDDEQKDRLLGQAAALLMPVQWDEPFGIVMAEALACGTPIIGLRRGSVPEVVREGITGFVCNTVEDMVKAVASIPALNRTACRDDMEQRFSDRAMVDAYERLYVQMIGAQTEIYAWS